MAYGGVTATQDLLDEKNELERALMNVQEMF